VRLLALLIFNLLSDFLGFCRLRWCAEILVCRSSGTTKKPVNFAQVDVHASYFNIPPKKKQNKENSQKGKR
jgi:hypothetical protein